MAHVKWTIKAAKQLRKLHASMRPVISKKVATLTDYKNAAALKRLTNHKYQYRLRVNDYRVLFDVNGDTVEVVLIQEVKKRDESTY